LSVGTRCNRAFALSAAWVRYALDATSAFRCGHSIKERRYKPCQNPFATYAASRPRITLRWPNPTDRRLSTGIPTVTPTTGLDARRATSTGNMDSQKLAQDWFGDGYTIEYREFTDGDTRTLIKHNVGWSATCYVTVTVWVGRRDVWVEYYEGDTRRSRGVYPLDLSGRVV